jgi:hypothetical protein
MRWTDAPHATMPDMLTVLLAQASTDDGGGEGWTAAVAFLAVAGAIALIQWRRQRRRRTGLWKQSPRS